MCPPLSTISRYHHALFVAWPAFSFCAAAPVGDRYWAWASHCSVHVYSKNSLLALKFLRPHRLESSQGGRMLLQRTTACAERPRWVDVGLMMHQEHNSEEHFWAGAHRPDRGHRLPRLSWRRMLRPGPSGRTMIGIFVATLITSLATVVLLAHY